MLLPCLQADVDLVSIMSRTGFLPSKPQQAGSTSLVTQGGSQVGQVTGGSRRLASDGSLLNQDTPKGGWQAVTVSSTSGIAAQGFRASPTPQEQIVHQRSSLADLSSGSDGATQQQLQPGSAMTQIHSQTVANEPTSNGSNGNAAAAAAQKERSQATANSSGASASASVAATTTVEGWVSNNLSSFVAEGGAASDLPAVSASEQTQQPAVTKPSDASTSTSAPGSQMQEVQQQQQQQQQQEERRHQQQWQQQQQQRQAQQIGGNVTQPARQSWGKVKQQGPTGAWQGRGQGPSGGSGGSWAQVDDQMENARRLLSPWRYVSCAFCSLCILFQRVNELAESE